MASPAARRDPERAETDLGRAETGARAAGGAPSVPTPTRPSTGDATHEALDLLVAALEHRSMQAAATAVVNRLAASVGARRVSLGLWNGSSVELCAVSRSAAFDAATGLSIAVRDAMHEAIAQRATMSVPSDPAASWREDAAQRVLLRLCGGGAVCTVPFADGTAVGGAVTLEWNDAQTLTSSVRERCEATLALVGPVLGAIARADLGFFRRLRDGLAAALRAALGPRRPLKKLTLLVAVALVTASSLVTGVHRVSGDAVLRGSVRRIVSAPVDGFIAAAPARPGDVVAEGALLATFDDQALSLEVAKWQAEYEQALNEYREALAQLDSARVTTLRAAMDRALAELELAEDNLARSEIRAPIAGVVVSGDFSQSLGAPLERGATLFELAPLDGYHVTVRVPEQDVGYVAAGQHGRLALAALPGESVELVVERVTPVSEIVDGRNVFEVEARLLDARDALRPGMQGTAKLDVGNERLLWIFTHDAVDWLRLQLWRLGITG
ncbi:MAG TPA: HlyD family efflux transporter periplasmic adaptor subunit [Gammaproteobacteria bacterium]|nr:HlyD family efflux transporter periplasmic adaptor subunit [Gammaproteobacteria bacterium]